MKHAIAVGIIFALHPSVGTALPWNQMTQEQGERAAQAVRPFILATVSCIAGAIPGNPKALAFARKKKWLLAAAETAKSCDQSFVHMESALDAAFEPGEGRRYTNTYFKKELPGNLAQRVVLPAEPRPIKIPAPLQSASPPATTRSADADAAGKKLLDAASDKQMACIRSKVVELVPYSSESAETLANVVMSRCASHEVEQVDVAIAVYGLTRANAESINAQISARTRQKVVDQIVTVRAEAARTAPAPQTGHGSSDGVPASTDKSL